MTPVASHTQWWHHHHHHQQQQQQQQQHQHQHHTESLIFNRSKTTGIDSSMLFNLSLPAARQCLFPLSSKLKSFPFLRLQAHLSLLRTRYPYQYEMIVSTPVNPPPPLHHRHRHRLPSPPKSTSPDSEQLDFDEWVHRKLNTPKELTASSSSSSSSSGVQMDRSKRKYYKKRRKRMYGSDSENENDGESDMVEIKQEIVELPTLHKREEELYFYDAFCWPWEKDKHYHMVYQLEKKYFPGQGFDKAFLEPGQYNETQNKGKNIDKDQETTTENPGLIFFDEGEENIGKGDKSDKSTDVKFHPITEKKVEAFFKGLRKIPSTEHGEPFYSSRSLGLPPKWDGPGGTMILVNKPKGWTSFTVCGKIRRLVQVKKVGHAGTLDPMATGLLIVCIGKATKVVDWYQGMTKSYSGIFRLGEATSTWDADSPVIQRESWEHIKDEDIKKAAASFCGEIWQVPPMFSAIKIGGERMYDKARRGEHMELSPRRISIFLLEVERSMEDRQNVIFRVTCSKGTYIRSLCADFGKTLGSCAHLTALRRDSIGEYSADDAWDFQELEAAIAKEYL